MRPHVLAMRRSIVPLSLVLAAAVAAAVWALPVAGSATAASWAPHIACPAQGGQIVPCCPPPVGAATDGLRPESTCCNTATTCCPTATPCCIGTTPCCAAATPCCTGTTPCCTGTAPCCTGSTCCPASGTCCMTTPCPMGSLTIASSPNPSVAGQKVVISGAVAGGSAGAQVVLWRELARQTSFQQVAQTTTDSAGRYSFTLTRGTVMADQAWYVTSNGMQSSTLAQRVAAQVQLASSTRSTIVGQTVVLHGHVTPSHARQVVLVEVMHGAAWRIIARPRLGVGSSYSVSRRFAQPGTVVLRVVLPADSRNAVSTSRTVAVTIKR